jgi:phage antirepressor YoqD-like protein
MQPQKANHDGVTDAYPIEIQERLEKLRKFKRWVTSEVLPSIRKRGAYMTNEIIHKALAEPDFLIQLATELKEEREKSRQLETKIEQDKPLIIFAGAVQTAQTSILIGDLAKILKQNGVNIGQKRLFEWLRQNGYLIKSGNSRNMPTQKAMELKLFEVKESTINNPDGSIRITKTTKVTGKGQTYFINKFLGDDDNGKT